MAGVSLSATFWGILINRLGEANNLPDYQTPSGIWGGVAYQLGGQFAYAWFSLQTVASEVRIIQKNCENHGERGRCFSFIHSGTAEASIGEALCHVLCDLSSVNFAFQQIQSIYPLGNRVRRS